MLWINCKCSIVSVLFKRSTLSKSSNSPSFKNCPSWYKELLVPQCQADMYCPEKHGCGAYPSKEEVQRLIKIGKECCKNKEELLTPLGMPIDLNKK